MKFLTCKQGSQQWFQARAGKCTASRFFDAISLMTRKSGDRVVGDPTAVADRYAADIAIEMISGKPQGEPPKAWVLERGHIMEEKARMLYEARTKAFVTEAGLCVDESGLFAYSSDGLVNDDGLIEIKSPIDGDKILTMLRTGDVSEYEHQMQGGMWITGRKWCDFIQYVPDLELCGKDLFVKRIYRNDAFIDAMVIDLYRFQRMVEANVAILRSQA